MPDSTIEDNGIAGFRQDFNRGGRFGLRPTRGTAKGWKLARMLSGLLARLHKSFSLRHAVRSGSDTEIAHSRSRKCGDEVPDFQRHHRMQSGIEIAVHPVVVLMPSVRSRRRARRCGRSDKQLRMEQLDIPTHKRDNFGKDGWIVDEFHPHRFLANQIVFIQHVVGASIGALTKQLVVISSNFFNRVSLRCGERFGNNDETVVVKLCAFVGGQRERTNT